MANNIIFSVYSNETIQEKADRLISYFRQKENDNFNQSKLFRRLVDEAYKTLIK
jgi:hypothetical protein